MTHPYPARVAEDGKRGADARIDRDAARNAAVYAQVHIGQPDGGEGFALQVDIQVEGVEDMDLIDAGHKVSCSNHEAGGGEKRRTGMSWGLTWSISGVSLQPCLDPRRSRQRHQSAIE